MKGAKGQFYHHHCGRDMTRSRSRGGNRIREEVDNDANIIVGATSTRPSTA